ncbi:hypothetical protein ACFWAY_18385 [Rhodococcus sp. NPDC059968]|uniref:hypothetical protein n=1 Tax=Rhodococcus sp. NPDC059968 TaxID=3347017 RepID=UPI003671761E
MFVIADRIERKIALLLADCPAAGALMIFGATTDTSATIVAGTVVQIALSYANTSSCLG